VGLIGPLMPSEGLDGPGVGALGGGTESPPTGAPDAVAGAPGDGLTPLLLLEIDGMGVLWPVLTLFPQATMDTISTTAPTAEIIAGTRHCG